MWLIPRSHFRGTRIECHPRVSVVVPVYDASIVPDVIPPSSPHISVVSPVYQAEGCISELCRRIRFALRDLPGTYEIILVDDASSDESWAEIVRESAAGDVVGLRLAGNVGQHKAITAGMDQASGQWVVVLDCDLQDPPELIPELYRRAVSGPEQIVAARFDERMEPAIRQRTSAAFWWALSYLSGMHFDPRVGNYRIMSRTVVDHFVQYREQERLLSGINSLMGFDVAYVSVSREARFAGTSSYSRRKLLSLAIGTTLAYSDKPLRITTWVGFTLAILSMIATVVVLLLWALSGIQAPGWTSIMLSLYFLGGTIIAVLGVIGLYVGRTFEEAKRRPLYIVGEKVGLRLGG